MSCTTTGRLAISLVFAATGFVTSLLRDTVAVAPQDLVGCITALVYAASKLGNH